MGATRPDGSSASPQRVAFTRNAADRIARVVRQVEGGSRDSQGLAWHPRTDGGGGGGCRSIFRIATYTGSWDINTSKTVTFWNITNTPNTVTASNLFLDLPNRGATALVGVVKQSNDWYLWTWQEFTATAVFASSAGSLNVVSGVTVGASISTAGCGVNVFSTQQTATVSVVQNTYTCVFVKLEP